VQLKIKIGLVPEPEKVQIAPFDYGKIARFSISVLLIISLALAVIFKASLFKSEPPKTLQKVALDVAEPSTKLSVEPVELVAKRVEVDVTAPHVAVPTTTVAVIPVSETAAPTPTTLAPKAPAPFAQPQVITAEASEALAEPNPAVALSLSPSNKSYITRMQLTSAILKREPVDDLRAMVSIDKLKKIMFYTRFIGLAGETVEHRWYQGQELTAVISLNVGSQNWRTYSSKNINRMMAGPWRVEVVVLPDTVIAQHHFTVKLNTSE